MAVKSKEMPFEKALERLEAIVDRLETGSVPLDEAVRLFEEGVGLRKQCLELLRRAEERVRFLTENAGGEPVESDPPGDWEADSAEAVDDER